MGESVDLSNQSKAAFDRMQGSSQEVNQVVQRIASAQLPTLSANGEPAPTMCHGFEPALPYHVVLKWLSRNAGN